jgi:hypothetical protein
VATQKKPTDFTGRQRDELVAQQLEDQAAQQNAAAVAQAEAARKVETEVIDATQPMKAEPVILDTVTKSEDSKATVTIRVSDNIEAMTFGAGNYYSFKAGQKYEVTPEVAAHLEEKGYVSARY